MFERIYDPECEASNAVNAAADPECTRDAMASFYADCIRATLAGPVDFARVNRAVLARWPRGLLYVKRRAWREVERRT